MSKKIWGYSAVIVILICSCGTFASEPTVEPIPMAATPRPAILQPAHVRLGVVPEDIDNGFKWCGMYQDAVRFEEQMMGRLTSSNWRSSDGSTPSPALRSEITRIEAQEFRQAVDAKWESVQPYMETMSQACGLVNEFCSLKPPRLIDATAVCNQFYDGQLPYFPPR